MQAELITAHDANPRAGACGTAQRAEPTDEPELESMRPALMRFARRALRNAADVEDVVQETLVAAVASPDAFGGRSSRMTWLLAILKHKIVDVYRRQAREAPLDGTTDADESDDGDALFTPEGHWREPPSDWGSPEKTLSQREFQRVLEGCIASLPERMARAFTMRELMELETIDICHALGISESHCFVMLHRARMKLRQLLEQRWFAAAGALRS